MSGAFRDDWQKALSLSKPRPKFPPDGPDPWHRAGVAITIILLCGMGVGLFFLFRHHFSRE
jgi:hypothetical protein